MERPRNNPTERRAGIRTSHRKHSNASDASPYENIDVLNTLSAGISQSPHLSAALDTALERLLEITEADIGSIHLLDPKTKDLVLSASRGVTQSFVYNEQRIPMGVCLCGLAARSGEVVVSDDLSKDERLSRSACRDARFGSMISVPLQSRDITYGIMTLYSKRSHAFSGSNRHLLVAISHHIGVAIENSQLYTKAMESARLEERWFISQELHDNIAQSLAYLNMQTKIIEDRLRTESKDQALEKFHQIRKVIHDTNQDVRNMLTDFRTEIKEDERLESALKKYCESFRERAGIGAEFVQKGDFPLLPQAIQTQVFRMVQESLSNIRKHAGAGKAIVTLRSGHSGLRITVEDNGKGFDLRSAQDPARRHMGLSILKERAASFHGSVRIATGPGRGTLVEIDIPLNHPSRPH
jgi:two-component system, NarL family, nitrate/nitrite sensor histidine kinase NarX